MAKRRLVYPRRDEPLPLLSCLGLSVPLSMVVFFALLPFCEIDKYSPGTTKVALCVFPVCVAAVLSWRVWRYGLPELHFNLSHLLMVVLASGAVGAVLAQGAHDSVLNIFCSSRTGDTGWRLTEDYFTTHPVRLIVTVLTFALAGLGLVSGVMREGEDRGWHATTINALVACVLFAILPALLLSVLALLEDGATGFCLMAATGCVSAVGWYVAVQVLGRAPRVRRVQNTEVKSSSPVVPATPIGKRVRTRPRAHQPRWAYVHVPEIRKYIKM